MNRAELKARAKQQIKGNIGILFLISLIIGVVSTVATLVLALIPVIGILISVVIIMPAFGLSVYRVYVNLANGKKPGAGDAFCGFNDFWSAFKVNFLVGLFTFLWSLLFCIPGIVKSYAYSMSMYVLADNKGKGALECINESKEMTKGHKWELFVLDLSFIGWYILGSITFGIAYIWIYPYIQTTIANVYYSLKPAVVVAEPVAIPEQTATEE